MIVYKYFMKIVLKNKATIISYILIFFVLSIINGSGVNNYKDDVFEEKQLKICIVNESGSKLADELISYLKEKNIVSFEKLSKKHLREQIFLDNYDAVVIISKEFEDNILKKLPAIEVYKDDRNISAYKIENLINKYIQFSLATYENGSFNYELVNKALAKSTSAKIIENNSKIKKSSDLWFRAYFNFTAYVILAIYIAVMGFVMIDFKEKNIENRIKISSTKLLDFNKQIYLGQLSLAIFITFIFIIGSIVLKGQYIKEVDYLKYIINTIVFSFSALCLVFLINNITSNRFVISGLSTVISLGTSFISGVMLPQEFIDKKVLAIAKFFPTYYFIKINETDINSLMQVKEEIFMQILFAITFLVIGLFLGTVPKRSTSN